MLYVWVNSDVKCVRVCAPSLARPNGRRAKGRRFRDAGEGNERANAMANATDPLARTVRGMDPQVRDESTRRRHQEGGTPLC